MGEGGVTAFFCVCGVAAPSSAAAGESGGAVSGRRLGTSRVPLMVRGGRSPGFLEGISLGLRV